MASKMTVDINGLKIDFFAAVPLFLGMGSIK